MRRTQTSEASEARRFSPVKSPTGTDVRGVNNGKCHAEMGQDKQSNGGRSKRWPIRRRFLLGGFFETGEGPVMRDANVRTRGDLRCSWLLARRPSRVRPRDSPALVRRQSYLATLNH